MKRTYLAFILICLMSICSTTVFAQSCPRCRGYGMVNSSLSDRVAGYGLSKKIGDCNVCGHYIFENNPHRHVTCQSCGGSGKRSASTRTPSSYQRGKSVREYDSVLYPSEHDYIQGLMKILYNGMTETRTCTTCGGSGRCPGPGRHHYGNMSDMWNIDAPMPVYCHRCDGWGDCPNKNCLKGSEFYTRPCTESEKKRINDQIWQIIWIACERNR